MRKLAVVFFALSCFFAKAQSAETVIAGVGIGLEYGGVGGHLGYQIDDQFGAFVGLGTAFASTGYNFGVKYLLPGDPNQQFFLEGLYGYNAVILVDRPAGDVRETFYGPSFGGGVNLHNKGGTTFWHFALLIPIRSSEYRNQFDILDNDPEVEIFALPFTVSIGLNFKL